MKKVWIKIGFVLICVFALIGFVLIGVYVSVELGWTKTAGIIDNQRNYFKNQSIGTTTGLMIADSSTWVQGDEWQTLKAAILKDADSINKASLATNVPARKIVAPLVVEQLRLFYSDREVFKEIFAPLQILGNQSQFSWGVMGIKQDTAKEIEANLKNPQSPFYLGSAYEHILDFPASTTSDNAQRFNRLTDEHDRYFSYLYAALMIKELETQWEKAGFSIADRPDVVTTLFNIGFQNSHPNANPQVGGAEIDIGSTTYSFGGLAGDFYNSNELMKEFTK